MCFLLALIARIIQIVGYLDCIMQNRCLITLFERKVMKQRLISLVLIEQPWLFLLPIRYLIYFLLLNSFTYTRDEKLKKLHFSFVFLFHRGQGIVHCHQIDKGVFDSFSLCCKQICGSHSRISFVKTPGRYFFAKKKHKYINNHCLFTPTEKNRKQW